MSLSKSFADPSITFVADASVVINLNATGRAADIIKAIPNRIAIAGGTMAELGLGARNGHDDAHQLQTLMDAGLIEQVQLGAKGAAIYESLIDGSARTTLDDGEAATIACAVEHGAIALLDERKARSLCFKLFTSLPLGCTAQLLMHDAVATVLNTDHIEAIIRALKVGRMRVPTEFVAGIVELIGPDVATTCRSLPRSARALVRQRD